MTETTPQDVKDEVEKMELKVMPSKDIPKTATVSKAVVPEKSAKKKKIEEVAPVEEPAAEEADT